MRAPYHLGIVLSIAAATHARLSEAGALDEDGAALLAEAPDVETVLVRLLRAGDEAKHNAEAVGERIAALQARQGRYWARSDECRRAVVAIMDAAGLTKFRHPEFTVSLSAGRPGVVVTDEAALPDRFVRVERKPLLLAIKAAMDDGEVVPGAEMQNTMPTLTVRTK